MRILILGAGGIGGYYGGRLAAAGVDVTFLVRPRRAAQLEADGLVIKSPHGDLTTRVRTVLRDGVQPGYDAILLSCKAYDLDDAIESIRPAAAGALVIPLLNGVLHLATLEHAFGVDAVAGGVAQIGVTLKPDGTIHHLNRAHGFIYGERTSAQAERCAALAPLFAKGGFDSRHSGEIMQDMWEKFVFLCSIAAMTTLMRGNVGAISRSDHGTALSLEMVETCETVAAAAGHPVRPQFAEFCRRQLTDRASVGTASMLRDLLAGAEVEAQHIVGDMLARAIAGGGRATLLKAAYTGLQVYQDSWKA
jgi:2-dehydropantoate 2-reductase